MDLGPLKYKNFDGDSIPAIERYRPMLRLLDNSDTSMLAADVMGPAFRAEVARERRKMFKLYLDDLARDHARVVHSIREILVQSSADRPELAKAMLKSQGLFTFLLFTVRCKLAFHAFSPAMVNVRPLLSVFANLNQLREDLLFVQAVQAAA
jgi:hypothetical protein